MLADLDETLRQLVVKELPIRNNEIDISFDQPKREWSARLTKPTINFFLYDVRENVQFRNRNWGGPQTSRDGRSATIKKQPFRIDCFYAMTIWATEAEDEHRLITSTLLALFRHSVFAAEHLVGQMQEQPYSVPLRVSDPEHLKNPTELWGVIDNEMRPTVSVMTTIALDPWQPIEVPTVRSFSIDTGRPLAGEDGFKEGMTERRETRYQIAGVILIDGEPKAEATVSVRGTGYSSVTDDLGRYVIKNLPKGEVGLIVSIAGRKSIERNVTLPDDNDFNFEL